MGEWNLFPSFKNFSSRLYLFLDRFIFEKCYPEAIGFNGHKEDKEKHQTSMFAHLPSSRSQTAKVCDYVQD